MFTEPQWLILIFPALIALFYFYKMQSKIMLYLRVMLIVSIFLAIAGLQFPVKTNEGTTVIVADRSLSMPDNIEKDINETFKILSESKPENAKLGIVSFGAGTNIELAPSGSNFSGLSSSFNPEASNISAGIQRALSLIPSNHVGKILLLSDGEFTGENPEQIAVKAAERGVKIDFRHYGRDKSVDTSIISFNVPNLLNPDEHFLARAQVYSPIKQNMTVSFFSNEEIIANYERVFEVGTNNLVFGLTAPQTGVIKYKLNIKSSFKDEIPENNSAVAIAEIIGIKPILVISNNSNNFLHRLFEKANIPYVAKTPNEINWSIEFLAGYSAVIADNISANKLTFHGMQIIASWVKYMGGGFMLVGGSDSYGLGGYFNSPIADILPLSMEMRNEQRKTKIALMIALDRSGSMQADAGGRTKMDLANLGASGSLKSLADGDEFGVLAVDTESHEVVPLHKLNGDIDSINDKILHIESSGGGIFVYNALETSVNSLLKSDSKIKHIILFADASDSEQPGEYWELLNRAVPAGITVSVIGLGHETDCDAELLKKIADAGNGRIFFTNEPRELPRIFLQDTYVAAKSTYADNPVGLTGKNEWFKLVPLLKKLPENISVNEYNICYEKNGSKNIIVTNDEEPSPILSYWQFGLGHTACLTAPFNENLQLVGNKDFSELILALCQMLINDDRMQISGIPIKQSISNGVWNVSLYLDPEREKELFLDDPEITLIRVNGKDDPSTEIIKMHRETADTIRAERQLYGNEVISGVISINGMNKTLPPICQPYSSEFFTQGFAKQKTGINCLRKIAAITGGEEITLLSDVWNNMPVSVKMKSVTFELLMLALVFFFLEIAERRLSLISILILKAKSNKNKLKEVTEPNEDTERFKLKEKIRKDNNTKNEVKIDNNKKVEETNKNSLLSAMRQVKRISEKRKQ